MLLKASRSVTLTWTDDVMFGAISIQGETKSDLRMSLGRKFPRT